MGFGLRSRVKILKPFNAVMLSGVRVSVCWESLLWFCVWCLAEHCHPLLAHCYNETTWITWKIKQNLEIWPFLNSLLEKWVWESSPQIDPATGVTLSTALKFRPKFFWNWSFFDQKQQLLNNVEPFESFWFLVCYAATQLATQLQQRCMHVKEAQKRLTESNGTPAVDFGCKEISNRKYTQTKNRTEHTTTIVI